MPVQAPGGRGWSQWINTVLLILVCTLLKLGYDDFIKKQQATNDEIKGTKDEIKAVNTKLSAQDVRMQKMEDYEQIWLTALPKVKEDVERHDRIINNHEYRIESLEKRTNVRP